jgi:hypothetical protein
MSNKVLNILKEYGQDANRRAPSIPLAEIETRSAERSTGRMVLDDRIPPTRRRSLAIALTAAIVAALAIASTPLLFRGMESEVAAPDVNTTVAEVPTTSAEAVPTDDADPTPAVSVPVMSPVPPEVLAMSGDWSLAYIAEHSASVRAALATPQGRLLLAGMGPHLAVSSDGGTAWEEADPSGTVRSQAGFLSAGAATNGDVVVVAGRTCELQGDAREYDGEPYESFPCPQELGLWATSDLQNWARVDLPESIFPTCVGVIGECYAGVEHLIGGSSGFLATGTFTTDSDPTMCTRYEVEQLVLTSHDGIAWMNHAAPQPGVLGLPEWQAAWDDPDCQVERALVPLGYVDGRWLTMLRFSTGFETKPAAFELDGSAIEWSSEWGQYRAEWQHLAFFDDQQGEWSLAGASPSPSGWLVAAQASGFDGIVLGGSTSLDCDADGAAIWLTTDGMSMESASFVGGSPTGCVSSIAASGSGYLAIVGDSDEPPSVWYSADGNRWHRADLPAEIHDPYLVSSSETVIVVGSTEIEVLRPATIDEDGNDTYAWMTEYVSAVWVWQAS